MPSAAETRIMTMGWHFLNARYAMPAKMTNELHSAAPENAAAEERPPGKNTVPPTEISAEAISPTTAQRMP